jgi:hypothetical protein
MQVLSILKVIIISQRRFKLESQAQLNVIDNATCYDYYRRAGVLIQADMLCTLFGPNGNETPCNGDSGSPLSVSSNGKHTQVLLYYRLLNKLALNMLQSSKSTPV